MATLATLAIVAPGYESTPNAQYWLTQGILSHASADAFGASWSRIIALWAAHQIASTPATGADHAAMPPGPVASEGAGSESITYAIPSGVSNDAYSTTPYGRAYKTLIARSNARGTLL